MGNRLVKSLKVDGVIVGEYLGSDDVSSLKGVKEIDGYMEYVLGFQTGYNMMASGTYDIFAKLQDFDPLFVIEAWRKDHATMTFGRGVIALAEKLAHEQQ
jgi:hypothetical protein